MKASEQINELAKALTEVQTELKNPEKNVQGYGYKYADLAQIIELSKPVLKKNGLSVTQLTLDDGNGRVGVETVLMHESGQWISSKLTLPIPEMKSVNATQQAGAAISYARRYALSSILNIAADEDTDAATSKEAPKKRASKSNAQYTTNSKMTQAQRKAIWAIMNKNSMDVDEVKAKYDIESMSNLTIKEASELIDKLNGVEPMEMN